MRQTKLPLYQQIRFDLEKKINEQTWKKGQLIPTEFELEKHYGVSRITIRQALKVLENKQLIKRTPGLGTVVHQSDKERFDFFYTQSYTNELKEMRLDTKTLEAEIVMINADLTLATIFQVSIGTQLYLFRRLRGNSAQKIVFSETYLLPVVKLDPTQELLYGSLYGYLVKHGIYFTKLEEAISAKTANPYLRDKLELNQDLAVLTRIRKAFDQHGKMVEYTLNYYNPSCYEYRNIIDQERRTAS
jgi:GntR family transcriptional regulator